MMHLGGSKYRVKQFCFDSTDDAQGDTQEDDQAVVGTEARLTSNSSGSDSSDSDSDSDSTSSSDGHGGDGGSAVQAREEEQEQAHEELV